MFTGAAMHVPVETVHAAEDVVQSVDANCLVAIGGGSTTGLAKALALDSGIPVIAIPTTYAGSEMTTMYGLTEDGAKRTGRDAAVLPRAVIYDPELSLGLPFAITLASAINAIAHAAEGLYAPDGNPVMNLFAEEGIRKCVAALARCRRTRATSRRRGDALVGVDVRRRHGQRHCGLHHSSATRSAAASACRMRLHTVVLPMRCLQRPGCPGGDERIAAALQPREPRRRVRPRGSARPRNSLQATAWSRRPRPRRGPRDAAQYPNPRPLERAPLRELLQRAWEGARPD